MFQILLLRNKLPRNLVVDDCNHFSVLMGSVVRIWAGHSGDGLSVQ